jgi:hypothetical protein
MVHRMKVRARDSDGHGFHTGSTRIVLFWCHHIREQRMLNISLTPAGSILLMGVWTHIIITTSLSSDARLVDPCPVHPNAAIPCSALTP